MKNVIFIRDLWQQNIRILNNGILSHSSLSDIINQIYFPSKDTATTCPPFQRIGFSWKYKNPLIDAPSVTYKHCTFIDITEVSKKRCNQFKICKCKVENDNTCRDVYIFWHCIILKVVLFFFLYSFKSKILILFIYKCLILEYRKYFHLR